MGDATGNPYRIYRITWVILLIITVAMLASEAFHLPRLFLILFLLCFMMVKAAHNEPYRLPLFGELAERSMAEQ